MPNARSVLVRCLLVAILIIASGFLAAAEEEPKERKAEDVRVDTAKELGERAYTLRVERRYAEALMAYHQSIELWRAIGGREEELARTLNELAATLRELGRHGKALPLFEEALAMHRRLFEGDHLEVAAVLSNVASTLDALGRHGEALPLKMKALAMCRRLFEGDHPNVGQSLNNLAYTLGALGRHGEALPLFEEVLAMRRRLFEGDHSEVALSLNNLAFTLGKLGSPGEALPLFEEALAMSRRLFVGDHPDVAWFLNNVASTLDDLGRHDEALPLVEEALAMDRRLFEGDHPRVARSLNNLALALGELGRPGEALPLSGEALAMRRRLFEGDHPAVATSLGNVAFILGALGRHGEALPLVEEALAMRRHLFEGDHPDVASSLAGVAFTLSALGRHGEALLLTEEALAMYRQLFEGDHPDVAWILNNVAGIIDTLGRHDEALPLKQEALAMNRRLCEGDHLHVASSLGNLAYTLTALGRHSEALPLLEEALAMSRRLFEGERPEVAWCLNNLACTLSVLGRADEAQQAWREAIAIGHRSSWPNVHLPMKALAHHLLERGDVEAAAPLLEDAVDLLETRRTQAAGLSSEGRARYVAEMRGTLDPFAELVRAYVLQGRTGEGLTALERGRGRELLDLLERGRSDPLDRALARARAEGDDDWVARIEEAYRTLSEAEAALLRAESAEKRARGKGARPAVRAAREEGVAARKALRKALRDRLHVVRAVLPEARPRAAAELQALLDEDERLLAYSLGRGVSYVFLVGPDGPVEVFALEADAEAVSLGDVASAARVYLESLRATEEADPDGAWNEAAAALFEMLVPQPVWTEIRKARRLYVLPHGPLHTVPFEALVVGLNGGEPRYWVDQGPPIAYASSGSVLAWLKTRGSRQIGKTLLVAVADPHFDGAAKWPEKGVLIRAIRPGGLAAEVGLRAGDVIVGYAGQDVSDLNGLREAADSVAEDAEAVPLRFEREGRTHSVVLAPGGLGVLVAREAPPVSGPKLLAQGPTAARVRSAGRYGRLVPLPGTRSEVERIVKAVRSGEDRAEVVALLGAEATEARLFEAVQRPRILHVATHGLVDETRGASFSALALTPPRVPVPGNDGFLTLADLLQRWPGRLDGTQLVVLSACESQRGKLERDEGMLALPWGFCFAGARSAIASLWHVDDESTAKLMGDLYHRLFSEESASACDALHAARRALKQIHPAPYHWASFVFVGAP